MVRDMIRSRARSRGAFVTGRMCTNFVDDVVRALDIELAANCRIAPTVYLDRLDRYLDAHPDRRGKPPITEKK